MVTVNGRKISGSTLDLDLSESLAFGETLVFNAEAGDRIFSLPLPRSYVSFYDGVGKYLGTGYVVESGSGSVSVVPVESK